MARKTFQDYFNISISIKKDTGINFEYGKDNWGFLTKEQDEVVSGWKIAKRRHQRWGGGGEILTRPT